MPNDSFISTPNLPPASLVHASTLLYVRQGETKIPLQICLSDKKNIKTKLNSTVILFFGGGGT
jgi:hypothetical protein